MWFWDHYVGTTANRSDPEMAPVLSKNLAKLPPSLVITAQHDVLRDDGKDYADNPAAGVDVQYMEADGGRMDLCVYTASFQIASERLIRSLLLLKRSDREKRLYSTGCPSLGRVSS